MSSIPTGDDVLDPAEPVLSIPDVASLLGIPVTKVHQQIRDGHLLALRRGGVLVVPQVFFADSGSVIKPLTGLLAVLRDGGYGPTESLRWLFTADPTLTLTFDRSRESTPHGRPVDALRSHQAREILRRAQALAY